MRNISWASPLVAALGLLSACPAGAQQPAPATPEQNVVVVANKDVSRWARAESEHFVAYSDAADEDVAQILNNLEKLDHLLRRYTRPTHDTGLPEQKLTLYYHSRPSELRDIAADMPAYAVGLYSSCPSGVEGFAVHMDRITGLGNEQLDKSPLNPSLSYVFEAYARHFLYRYTDIRTPASFIEGFAQYFSSVRFSERQMVVGRTPQGIGEYLNFLDEGHVYSLDYDDVLQQNDRHARNPAGADGVRLEFEARSWLLTHYMLSTDDRRKRTNRYLDLVARGRPATAAFERAFGLKMADVGETLWRYRRRGVETLRVDVPSLPSARVSVRTLPRAAGDFVVAQAALKACPGRQAGESLLKKIDVLAAQHPGDDLARLTLSRAQIDWGRPEDALPLLQAVLHDDDAHAEAWYLLGAANLRLSERLEGEARRPLLEAAQRHLERALALDPASPEAAFALFRTELAARDEPRATALAGVVSAWQNAREVSALARSAALAYAYTGDAARARQALDALAQNARDPSMAQWAREWQGRMEAGAGRADILAEMRRDLAPAASREWTIDKEDVMMAVARNEGLERAQPLIRDLANRNAPTPVPTTDLSGRPPKR